MTHFDVPVLANFPILPRRANHVQILSATLWLPPQTLPAASAAVGSSSPLDLDAVRRLYGSALAMRLSTERRLASGVGGRLPGMDAAPESHAMLDALTGDDLTLDFGDYLNLPEHRPDDALGKRAGNGPVVDAGPHAAMEARLGL